MNTQNNIAMELVSLIELRTSIHWSQRQLFDAIRIHGILEVDEIVNTEQKYIAPKRISIVTLSKIENKKVRIRMKNAILILDVINNERIKLGLVPVRIIQVDWLIKKDNTTPKEHAYHIRLRNKDKTNKHTYHRK